jgi:hypothetical protein
VWAQCATPHTGPQGGQTVLCGLGWSVRAGLPLEGGGLVCLCGHTGPQAHSPPPLPQHTLDGLRGQFDFTMLGFLYSLAHRPPPPSSSHTLAHPLRPHRVCASSWPHREAQQGLSACAPFCGRRTHPPIGLCNDSVTRNNANVLGDVIT